MRRTKHHWVIDKTLKALHDDPLSRIVKGAFDAGISEEELAELLRQERTIPEEVRVTMRNTYRDIRNGFPVKSRWGFAVEL